jgi:hypothetical protein
MDMRDIFIIVAAAAFAAWAAFITLRLRAMRHDPYWAVRPDINLIKRRLRQAADADQADNDRRIADIDRRIADIYDRLDALEGGDGRPGCGPKGGE